MEKSRLTDIMSSLIYQPRSWSEVNLDPAMTCTTVTTPEGKVSLEADKMLYEQLRAMAANMPPMRVPVQQPVTTVAEFDKIDFDAPIFRSDPPEKHIYRNCYSALGRSKEEVREMVDRLAEDLPPLMHAVDADCVVVRGTSGLAVAFHLWMRCDFPIIVARKRGEHSHDGMFNVIGPQYHVAKRYLILDDFASTGNTVHGIREDMSPAVLAGTLAYRRCENRDHEIVPRHDIAGAPYFEYKKPKKAE